MGANEPPDDPPAPATFSLGTLLLIAPCVGLACAAFRASGDHVAVGAALAMVFIGGFLALWFVATKQFGRLKRAVILACVGVTLLPIALVSAPSPRIGGHQAQCGNNLKQIGLALLYYEQHYGSFPPVFVADANGKPLLSWRALILPQMENATLAARIRTNETWDGPNNAKVTNTSLTSLQAFCCPSEIGSATWSPTETSYVAVVGPHTAWSGATPRKLSEFKNPSGTILVIEIAHSGIQWAEPRDLYIGQMPMSVNPKVGQGISSDHADGVNAVFVDGSVHFIPNSIDPKTLAELLDLDGCSDPSAY